MRRSLCALLAVPAVLAVTAPAASAQNANNSAKLREAVTLEGVRAHQAAFQSIADSVGGNRFAGLPGHDRSAGYVAEQLTAAGYAPTTQTFTYNAFFEKTPSRLLQVAPTPTEYVNGNDFRVLSYSGSGDATGELQKPSGDNRGCYAQDWAGFTPGRVALVQRGTPAGFPGGACTFRIKVENAIAAGAAAVLVYNNTAGVLNGTLGEGPLSARPALGLTQALGEQLGATPGTTMRVVTNTDSRPLETKNVIAEKRGSANPDNVVMVGAHLDSVTAGPGINDNGSGSAAILETAIQMAKTKPHNTLRFAWWSAEESGLVGATRYVAGLSQAERDKLALYLNFDMVGSPNFARFVYDGNNSTGTGSVGPQGSDVIERVFYGYFESQGLPAEPTPFNGRSDYGPFIAPGVDVPAGGLFTGAEGTKNAAQALRYGGVAGQPFDPCYHAACDTFANNSAVALDTNADAIAHVTITFAQNTEAVNGVPGKDNFASPAQGADDGGLSGAGGGGGLHDHDHDRES